MANRVPLTKNNLQAPFVARNFYIAQWSIFMVSTDLFQAFRWAENGASGEQRENNKRTGVEKESKYVNSQ